VTINGRIAKLPYPEWTLDVDGAVPNDAQAIVKLILPLLGPERHKIDLVNSQNRREIVDHVGERNLVMSNYGARTHLNTKYSWSPARSLANADFPPLDPSRIIVRPSSKGEFSALNLQG
jgi:hypothetical protein